MPSNTIVFYNQAPHPAIPYTVDQTPSAIDFGPSKVVDCRQHPERPIEELSNSFVSSISAGTVTFVGGDERDSQTHSIVQVQNSDNTTFTYVHLDNIPQNIRERIGRKIASGETLGTFSCEVPNDTKSKTTGAHVHVIYGEIKNGQNYTKSIVGQTFSGYKVKEDGSMVRENEVRVANEYRCDSSGVKIFPCNDQRNDLNPHQPEYFPGDSRYHPKSP